MGRKKTELTFKEMVREEFGDLFIFDEEKKEEKIKTISTGSISLDISLGIGGIPIGRFTEIYGAEGSGKTTLALSIAKNAIETGNKVLYIDPEIGVDFEYAKLIVGDFDGANLILIQPELMEDSLQVAEFGIQSKEFNLIILDSIGSLAPKKVKEDDLTDANVALLSRIMTTFVQRNAFDVFNSSVAFVGINQVRDKIGSYYSTYETPGGHAWKHILSTRIFLSKVEDIKKGNDTIGINARFTVRKNKLAPPFRSYSIPIIFGEGIDRKRDLIDFAEMLGVLTKAGAYIKLGEDTLGQGVVKTIEYLEEHPDTLDKIEEMCYNKVGVEKERLTDEETTSN